MDIPGVKRDNLKINVMTERANQKFVVVEGKRDTASFSQRFCLDDAVLIQTVAANLCDGVLVISATKKEKPAPIEITVGEEEVVTMQVDTNKEDEKETSEDPSVEETELNEFVQVQTDEKKLA